MLKVLITYENYKRLTQLNGFIVVLIVSWFFSIFMILRFFKRLIFEEKTTSGSRKRV